MMNMLKLRLRRGVMLLVMALIGGVLMYNQAYAANPNRDFLDRLNHWGRNIQNERYWTEWNQGYRAEQLGELRSEQERLQALDHLSNDQQRRLDRIAGDIARLETYERNHQKAEQFWEGVADQAKEEMNSWRRKREDKAKAAEERQTRVEEAKAYMQSFFQGMRDPEVLMRTGLFLTGSALGVAGMYYLTKYGYEYAKANMDKPSLVRETSRGSLSFSTLWKYLFDEEPEAVQLGNVVLSPEIEKKVHLLADDVKRNREYGLPYQNVMFYGPPGTGKTEFAKLLAHYSEMDYAILSGADFSQFQDGKGIVELHKLFDWGNSSDKGLIIFFDEADAFLRDREGKDSNYVNLVNAFLSRTGAPSDKYMFILATNYKDELDRAVRDRTPKKIPFNLPGLDERRRIIELKFNKYIFNDKRIYTKDGQEIEVQLIVAPNVTSDYLALLAQKTEGFSGRGLEQMVAEIRLRAYSSGNNTVDVELIEAVVNDKKIEFEEDRRTTEYQRKRAQASKAALSHIPV